MSTDSNKSTRQQFADWLSAQDTNTASNNILQALNEAAAASRSGIDSPETEAALQSYKEYCKQCQEEAARENKEKFARWLNDRLSYDL